MASYLYTNRRREETVERFFKMGKAPKRVQHRGARYDRDCAAEIRSRGARKGAGWPMYSNALGVLPEQVPSEIARLKEHGLDVEFDKTGRPLVTGPRHQTAICRTLGMVNKDAGYAETYEGSDRD